MIRKNGAHVLRLQRILMGGEREGIFIPTAALNDVDSNAPPDKCRFYVSISHSGRLKYED